MKDIKAIVAIGGIVVLESIALMKGIDGTILTMVVATLAGLGGYYIRGKREDEKTFDESTEDYEFPEDYIF
ncbi:MAG: hypothetical protein J7J91_01080 [Deltaproteobacteria bacterium]|nr:hypothetical protein [Deltaproteobacteria bacterium]